MIPAINQIKQLFPNKRNGRYIEIGAGPKGNSTYDFEHELQWSGILVEPNKKSYEQLKQTRPNNTILNEVISCRPMVEFHSYLGDSIEMSAIPDDVPDELAVLYYNDEIVLNEEKIVEERETTTLSKILNNHSMQYDFIVIDTNGNQLDVLESWDFKTEVQFIIIDLTNVELENSEKCEQHLSYYNYEYYDCIFMNDTMFDVYKKIEYVNKCLVS